jgi:uncharacterized coiled-coil protein SlyX
VEHKPTPPSGMPAAVITTSPKPLDDEISAPKSEATAVILAALGDVRTEFVMRFERLETTTAAHGKTLVTLSDQVTQNTKNIADQATALTSVAESAAIAAKISAQALSRVGTVQDDTQKMVESAMAIQKGAIATAVKDAVKPLEKQAEQREKKLEQSNEALGVVVEQLGVSDRVSLGANSKPGEKQPEPTLEKMEKRAKQSTIVQAIIALGVIAEVLSRVIGHH